ncbi:MAG: molybdopterin-dependent oxidoreductase [Eggerthellaceae bacterium]|nr:molybdopterin-dependent oxidoreductase [Eggerthellaceae bacterium]
MSKSVSRRTFVKGSALAGLGAAAVGSGALFGCSSEGGTDTPAPAEEKVCWGHCDVNCETRCALQFHVVDDEVVWVESDNTGSDVYGDHQLRACQRGRSIRRWINHPDRLSYPMKRVGKRGSGEFEQITWEEAIDTIVENYKRILDQYGPAAIYSQYASGVNSGNIGGFLSRFLNLNGGRLNRYGSYSSAQISNALPWLYGTRAANGNSDIINSKLVVMFGENSCETKQAGAGPTYHLMHALENGEAKCIIIDPRYSDSVASRADQWIPIRPGTDAALVDALAYVLITEDLVDHDFLAKYCIGYDDEQMPEELKGQGKSYCDYILGTGYDMTPKTPEWASPITGIATQVIIDLAREIGTAKPCAIYQGKGPQRHHNGEQTARAICMLPVLTGNVGINGGNTGSDLDGYYMPAWFGVPSEDNGVAASISCFTWTDAIERGAEMTRTKDGVRGVEKLEVPIKFIWNYAGNTMTNQHGDINHAHEVLSDESLCEFIVLWDTFMTDSAKYADILLPDLMPVEQPNIIQSEYAGNMAYYIIGDAVTSPKFERRTLYSVLTDIADKMGQKEAFTEGRDEMAWLQYIYETQALPDDPDAPTFEEIMAKGFYKKNCPEGEHVALKAFRDDPEANPLNTPSGKIEIYSQALMDTVADWELAEGDLIHPLPVYCPEVEGYADPLAETYPLQLIGYHTKARTHSSYGCIEVLKQANPQELWMNPIDAEARGLADGDKVKVYNDRGTVEIVAKVTPRILPGVVAMGQGAWHDADMFGDKVDKGGCINTLTTHRPSPYAKANPQHTNLVEVKLA